MKEKGHGGITTQCSNDHVVNGLNEAVLDMVNEIPHPNPNTSVSELFTFNYKLILIALIPTVQIHKC